MAPRPPQGLPDRPWDTPTKGLLWTPNILAPFQADANMQELLAELAAEEQAAQLKGSKPRRKKNKKKAFPDAPPVSCRAPVFSCRVTLTPDTELFEGRVRASREIRAMKLRARFTALVLWCLVVHSRRLSLLSLPPHHGEIRDRTATSQKCAAVPRRARI